MPASSSPAILRLGSPGIRLEKPCSIVPPPPRAILTIAVGNLGVDAPKKVEKSRAAIPLRHCQYVGVSFRLRKGRQEECDGLQQPCHDVVRVDAVLRRC